MLVKELNVSEGNAIYMFGIANTDNLDGYVADMDHDDERSHSIVEMLHSFL